MTIEAERLMAEALKVVKLQGSFSPATIGKRIGLDRHRAESAARALSNAGILVLGFDCDAEFSPHFRKANRPPSDRKPGGRKK
jgi:hypothetical protein